MGGYRNGKTGRIRGSCCIHVWPWRGKLRLFEFVAAVRDKKPPGTCGLRLEMTKKTMRMLTHLALQLGKSQIEPISMFYFYFHRVFLVEELPDGCASKVYNIPIRGLPLIRETGVYCRHGRCSFCSLFPNFL